MQTDFADWEALRDLTLQSPPGDFERLQKNELEFLDQLYGDDLKVLVSAFPCKFQVSVRAFWEGEYLVMPPRCTDYSAVLLFELHEQYPLVNPAFRVHSPHRDIAKGAFIAELQDKAKPGAPNATRGFLISALCEELRAHLLERVKRESPDFRRIRHYMDKEVSEEEKEETGAWEGFENLRPKAKATPVTAESFNEWLRKFVAETRAANPKQQSDKPTGKQIFAMMSSDLFVIDTAEEGDSGDEDADYERQEELEVDEELFVEDDCAELFVD